MESKQVFFRQTRRLILHIHQVLCLYLICGRKLICHDLHKFLQYIRSSSGGAPQKCHKMYQMGRGNAK